MKLYEACAYVIVDEDKLLSADRGASPSKPVVEGKRWAAVKDWLPDAKDRGERVPFIVWDAKRVHRWLGWGLLVDADVRRLDEHHDETEFRFQNLRPLGGHLRSDLVLLKQQRPLSEGFIRSYARLRTPQFLHELAEHDGPLLPEWLCTPEAVAHVFRTVYADDGERREAEEVLGRALVLADQAAHGDWGVILTPGRIRVVVGDRRIVEVGHGEVDELLFYPGPEAEAEEDDPDESLADLFAKYESRFRAHLESLRAARGDDRSPAEVARDYLAAQGHPPPPTTGAGSWRSHAEAVLEYLAGRGCLPSHFVRSDGRLSGARSSAMLSDSSSRSASKTMPKESTC